jgi:hypothetical protein
MKYLIKMAQFFVSNTSPNIVHNPNQSMGNQILNKVNSPSVTPVNVPSVTPAEVTKNRFQEKMMSKNVSRY